MLFKLIIDLSEFMENNFRTDAKRDFGPQRKEKINLE